MDPMEARGHGKVLVQTGIGDFNGVFQDRSRTMVGEGILDLIAQEVTNLCGESVCPDDGIYRRAGTELCRSTPIRARSPRETKGPGNAGEQQGV